MKCLMPNNENKTRMIDQLRASVLNAVKEIAQPAISPYGIHHHLHYKCLSIKLLANADQPSPIARSYENFYEKQRRTVRSECVDANILCVDVVRGLVVCDEQTKAERKKNNRSKKK